MEALKITEVSISLSEILVAILVILTGSLGYIIKEQREKIKSIENQLSEKKYRVYHEIFSIFFDVFKAQKKLINTSNDDLALRMLDVKKDLIIYAPDRIVNKFFDWTNSTSSTNISPKHLKIFLELCVLIRKDMGHKKTSIGAPDILRAIIDGEDEFEKVKELLN
ncbi:hypothetical protein [Hymenobacter properus]|uniref:Uncharacterized protein n=1 Tax=Hymenobacter properus TaxID=2791026 RepID=A0A931BGZ2_9BACT|nr:hypothetical protein [Hymenobacter properus]MBF9143374.1 hypothetical protein [Hymenobacter properus]MBR7722185.1 hypothetical protein [Microvirga sp. SRT04]